VTVWLSTLAVAVEHGHCGEHDPPHFNPSHSHFSADMIAEVTRFFFLLRTFIWDGSPKPARSWTIEFERSSSKVTTTPPSHSINLIARAALSKWHVRVTFGGELQHDTKLSQKPYRVKWDDFRSFCYCIDFNELPLLVDTVTELYITPESSNECQRLPFIALPSANGDYAPFRKRPSGFASTNIHVVSAIPLILVSGILNGLLKWNRAMSSKMVSLRRAF